VAAQALLERGHLAQAMGLESGGRRRIELQKAIVIPPVASPWLYQSPSSVLSR
jgi:hypothetical protein